MIGDADWGDYAWKINGVIAADAEKVVVAPEGREPFAFRLGDVSHFHARRTVRGAAIGAGVGAALGAVGGFVAVVMISGMGYRSVNDPPDNSGFPIWPALGYAAIGAVGYAIPGALIGALTGSPEDFPLALGPAPANEYASPAPPPTLAPRVALAPPAQRAATVVAPSAEVRSAPSRVAPVIVTLSRGQRLQVDPTPNAGWRVASLPDGRVGYVQDAQVAVDSP